MPRLPVLGWVDLVRAALWLSLIYLLHLIQVAAFSQGAAPPPGRPLGFLWAASPILERPEAALAFGLALLVAARAWREIFWSSAGRLRWAVLVMAAALAWEPLFGPYNFYWRNAFVADRLVLLGALLAVALRPAGAFLLVPPLVWLTTTTEVPFRASPWASQSTLLFALLSLQALVVGEVLLRRSRWRTLIPVGLTAILLIGQIYRYSPLGVPAALLVLVGASTWLAGRHDTSNVRQRWTAFLLFLLGLVAGHYLDAAFAKLTLGPTPLSWVVDSDLALSPSFVDFAETQPAFGQDLLLQRFSIVLNAAALAIELGVLLVGFHYQLARGILLCLGIFHLVVGWLLGIIFLGWILTAGVLLWALGDASGSFRFRGWASGLLVAAVALASSAILSFPRLGWFETPFGHKFSMTGVTAQGIEVPLGDELLGPYDFATYENPFFLLEFPALSYGTRDHDFLLEARELSLGDVREWVQEEGQIGYDARQRAVFDLWLRANFLGRSAIPPRGLERWLGPKDHQRASDPITYVHVRFQQYFVSRGRRWVLTDKVVYTAQEPGVSPRQLPAEGRRSDLGERLGHSP